MFSRGDIVWGKLSRCPWWPAVVLNPDDCGRDDVAPDSCWILWFGDYKVNEVEYSKLLDFQLHFRERSGPRMGKKLKSAVEEVLTILADRYNFHYETRSQLFKWADECFIRGVARRATDNSLSFGLPDVVVNALKKDHFKCKYESTSEEDSENEIDKVLKDVSKGNKTLEDVCVICCKPGNHVVKQHPFVGGVCLSCKSSAKRIKNLSKGQMNYVCFICGNGGTLVYCYNRECMSSYCKICIDYMTSEGTFSKIVDDNKWKCYLCEPKNDVGCHIKRKELPVEAS